MKSFSSLLVFTLGSFEITPVPEHGASRSTLMDMLGSDFRASSHRIHGYSSPVESSHDSGKLATIVTADDDVADTQTSNVTNQTLGTLLVGIVGEDDTSVLEQRLIQMTLDNQVTARGYKTHIHHGRAVSGLSTRGRGHIKNSLISIHTHSLVYIATQRTHASKTYGCGESAMTGKKDAAAWIM